MSVDSQTTTCYEQCACEWAFLVSEWQPVRVLRRYMGKPRGGCPCSWPLTSLVAHCVVSISARAKESESTEPADWSQGQRLASCVRPSHLFSAVPEINFNILKTKHPVSPTEAHCNEKVQTDIFLFKSDLFRIASFLGRPLNFSFSLSFLRHFFPVGMSSSPPQSHLCFLSHPFMSLVILPKAVFQVMFCHLKQKMDAFWYRKRVKDSSPICFSLTEYPCVPVYLHL